MGPTGSSGSAVLQVVGADWIDESAGLVLTGVQGAGSVVLWPGGAALICAGVMHTYMTRNLFQPTHNNRIKASQGFDVS